MLDKLTINAPNITIPGTGITLPFTGSIYDWEKGCTSGTGKTECNKKQHEQAVSAPGNRVNDGNPIGCPGTHQTFQCQDKVVTIPVAPGWDFTYPCIQNGMLNICTVHLTNPVAINIPHGCEEKPATRSAPPLLCPNEWQKYKEYQTGS